MNTWASVMTGKGLGAIATIQVLGEQAGAILGQVFRPAGSGRADFSPGRVMLGSIVDNGQPLDQVVVGCEDRALVAIHCHANPMIVETVMLLLERSGARCVSAEEMLARVLGQGGADSLQIEAGLAQAHARTLTGARLISHQVTTGLRAWLLKAPHDPLPEVQAQARQILAHSRPARLIVRGCTGVLAGPPNSGKSTLLNWLAGEDRALVSDIRGTTRDWVQAECQLGPLCVDLVDTAGLDHSLTHGHDGAIDLAAQERTLQKTAEADLVLLILDNSQPTDQIDRVPLERLLAKPLLTVVNKCDLQTCFDAALRPASLVHLVQVSAACRVGREALVEAVCRACGVWHLALTTPVALTQRQEVLVQQLARSTSSHQVSAVTDELLHGPI